MRRVMFLVAGIVASCFPLYAHHGNASYVNKQVTIKGTVTAWLWINPHTFLKVDVKDDKGNTIHWICENNAPSTLVNFGFTANTFKPGDQVTVVMDAVSPSANVGRVSWVQLSNGQVLMTDDPVRARARADADSIQGSVPGSKKAN